MAEIITLRAIALKRKDRIKGGTVLLGRDHNATSYSTETAVNVLVAGFLSLAEIITLRAIALKRDKPADTKIFKSAEIITLRAIALKPRNLKFRKRNSFCRDHNATSYSTETTELGASAKKDQSQRS